MEYLCITSNCHSRVELSILQRIEFFPCLDPSCWTEYYSSARNYSFIQRVSAAFKRPQWASVTSRLIYVVHKAKLCCWRLKWSSRTVWIIHGRMDGKCDGEPASPPGGRTDLDSVSGSATRARRPHRDGTKTLRPGSAPMERNRPPRPVLWHISASDDTKCNFNSNKLKIYTTGSCSSTVDPWITFCVWRSWYKWKKRTKTKRYNSCSNIFPLLNYTVYDSKRKQYE